MKPTAQSAGSVLVWGGLGFMGQHLVERLLGQGRSVSVLCRSRSRYQLPPWAGQVQWFEIVEGADVRSVLRKAVASATVVFDFAGASGAMASNRDPVANLDANCRRTLDLLWACEQAAHCPHVVFASSWLVYGLTPACPADEDHPFAPASMYAAHKLCAENYLRIYARQRRITYTVCRISNPYGYDPSRAGTTYKVLNMFIQRALAGEPITLFGDGSQLRDFIYISDVVDGLIACGFLEKAKNQTFNLSSGQSHSLREAVEMICALAGRGQIVYQPWPPEYAAVESGDYVADITRIRSRLGFVPAHDLASGLRKSILAYQTRASAALPAG